MDFSQLKQLALPIVLLTLVGCTTAPKSLEHVNQPSSEWASEIGAAQTGDTIQLPPNHSLGVAAVVVDRTYFAASGRECRRMRDTTGAPIQRVACKSADGQWQFARDLMPVSTARIQSQHMDSELTGEQSIAAQAIASQPLIPSAGSALLLNKDGTISESAIFNEDVDPRIISEPIGATSDSANMADVIGNAVDGSVVSAVNAENNERYAVDLVTDDATNTVQRELYANETLWSFAKRTTGNALNWQVIAEINNITDAKTLAPGAQLNIPVELVGDGG